MPQLRVLMSGLALLGACVMAESGAAKTGAGRQLGGLWGGVQIALEFEGKDGTLSMSCADGTIVGPVRLDRQGRFSVPGTFHQGAPGPERMDDFPNITKVRYAGQVIGDQLKLTITRAGSRQPETHLLRKGMRAKIVRCL
jgi:hypothetical protein